MQISWEFGTPNISAEYKEWLCEAGGGVFCVYVFPPLHPMAIGKTGGLFARSSFSGNVMIF